jgi:hypothetical protein
MAADWTTIASLATAAGTMVLAIATFVSVRSANRAARIAEQGFLLGQRPLLMPSRADDPPMKVMWVDEHWAHVDGGRASVELVDGVIYLAMSLRDVGRGTAVMQGWLPARRETNVLPSVPEPDAFRAQSRDLYVPSGDVGFWQAAVRDRDDADRAWLEQAVTERSIFLVHLLYSDHEGAQRAIGTFALAPGKDEQWLCSSVRHRNLDRPNPR